MHDTALMHGRLFFELYWPPGPGTIVELGSYDVNGSLRRCAPAGARYIGLDMASGPGVEVVVQPGLPLPLADACAEVVVTSSAFEHDAAFWDTFLELLRILRPGGVLYLNAPSNHLVHRHPVDCWRFYPDAGQALAGWASRRGVPVALVESFTGRPGAEGWADFVAVFHKPGPGPLARRGRIADRVPAANILDGSAGGAPVREAERPETEEILAIAALRAELGGLRAELDRLGAEAAAAGAARMAAEARLDALLASTSWRITAPLRALAGRLRRSPPAPEERPRMTPARKPG